VKSLLVDHDADEHSKHDPDDRTMVRIWIRSISRALQAFARMAKAPRGGA
jgi:hypothetical protein